jgi:PAS domain S-box-containing protein
MTSTQRLWLALGIPALVAGAVAVAITATSNHVESPALVSLVELAAGWGFIGAGLFAWARWPGNRTGRLMVLVGFCWFLTVLNDANDPWLFTIGAALSSFFIAPFVHVLLGLPDGRLATRAERIAVAIAYPAALLANVTLNFVSREPDSSCDGCPANRFLLVDSSSAQNALGIFWDSVGVAIAVFAVIVLVGRWRGATPAARRVLGPVLLSGLLTLVLLAATFLLEQVSTTAQNVVGGLALAAFLLVPWVFLLGLLRLRLARAGVRRLFIELSEDPSMDEIHGAFRHALRDPTVRLAHWLPERQAFVDLDGQPFEADDSSAMTLVETDGRRVGAIAHDPSLDEWLVEDAVASARATLARDRMQADLRARLNELERERDFVRTVVETAPALFCVLDHDGGVLRFNTALERLSAQQDRPELHGRAFWDLFLPPEERHHAREVLARARAGETGVEAESVWRTPSGGRRVVSWSLGPIVDTDGQQRFLLTGTDVTERKKHEEELEASERRNRAILDALPDFVFRIRRDGVYTDFHVHDEEQLYAPGVIGRTVYDRLPLDVAELTVATIQRAFIEGGVQTCEYQLELRGEVRHYEARMVASGDNEVISIVRDITDRMRQENELRASEARSRALLAAIPDLMFRVTRDGVFVDFQADSDFHMRRGPRDEILGTSIYDLGEDRDLADSIMASASQALATGKLETLEFSIGNSVREARIVPSGVDEVLMIVRDITARKQQDEKVERLLGELRVSRARIVEAADQERRRLERNLHDGAQQRLVSLSLALRLAQGRLPDDPAAASELLTSAGRELAHALEELRELARGIHPAILTDRGLTAAVEALAARAPLPVVVEALPDERLPGPVEAAAYYVIAEGLTNVVKYADASSVRVSVARNDGYACVEVADDGVGGVDLTRGTGLRGLADRVEALDGRLEVDSPAGEGTRLRAEIPVSREE